MKNIFKLIACIAAPALLLSSCAEVEYPEKSSECQLLTISLKVQVPQLDEKVVYTEIAGDIDNENNKVTFIVPYYTSDILDVPTDITKVFIVASVPVGAIITPGLGGLLDMSEPKDITITASDGSTMKYTLTAEVRKSSAKAITAFSFAAGEEGEEETFTGIVKEEEGVVYFMAGETSYAMLETHPAVPTVEVSPRAEIVTDITKPMNFYNDQTITVKAQDGSTQDWIIRRMAPSLLEYGFGYTKKCWVKNSDELGTTADLNFRGMCVTKNYVVVHDRYFSHLLFNKEDGSFVGKAAVPAGSLGSMYVAKDDEGNLVTLTYPAWAGGNLGVYYHADGETNAPTQLANVALAGCGRKFAVKGSLKSGVAYIYTAHEKATDVYRLKFVDGAYDSYETIAIDFHTDVEGEKFSYLPSVSVFDNSEDSDLIITDHTNHADPTSTEADKAGWINLYDCHGNFKASMADGVRCPGTGVSSDGKIFKFNNATYFMSMGNNQPSTTSHIRIYDVTDKSKFTTPADSEELSKFFVFRSEDIISSTNGNGTGAVDFDLAADGSTCDVYIWLTSGDLMKVQLTKIQL